MKTKLLSVLTLCFTAMLLAQNGFNYKALVKDNSGNAISNQQITVQFQILESGTTNVYQETHTPTTDANGIIIVNIGEGNVDSGDFTTIDWGANDHFLNVQIDSGSGLVDLSTTQFKSVPYAKVAEMATTLAPQPNRITNLNYPDGFEGMEPVAFKRTFTGNDFEVPPGKNLYITHIVALEGADITITSINFLLITRKESSNGFQSLTQPLIVGGGENLTVGASTTRVYGFLIDANVTPVFSDTSDYTVPANKILMITNTRSDIRYREGSFLQSIYLGSGNSQTTAGRSSFFQPIPFNEGQIIVGNTWSGYLIDKE